MKNITIEHLRMFLDWPSNFVQYEYFEINLVKYLITLNTLQIILLPQKS